MSASGANGGSADDLAAMLAAMDSRLQALQRELEEVVLPITRRGVQQAATGRPVIEPSRASGAQVDASEADELRDPPAPEDAPAPAPGSRGRRVTAVPGSRAARPAARKPAAAASQPDPKPAARPQRGPAKQRARRRAEAAVPDALVRETILAAETEARGIAEDARDRIAAIGARTRALLEQSLVAPAQAPAPPAASVPGLAPGSAPLEERVYEGSVVVEVGPFGHVAELKDFEDALAAMPAVEDVYIRTFEQHYAHFELLIAEPTLLIAELRACTADTLRVIDATALGPRLEIVRDGAGSTS